ncbi:hypothetical protein PHLCEN_2v7451 [Hermanssonia centrifuga]|uniref:Uncharacterized protein n=1 Tax=Hermanssonia centrifuga TaxID=98765 RepID=A0A2R6NWR0_9APHY|nr:hypothetical protein PHLCEN_2v7451 [Hermanssonia centrifuga]
MNQVTYWQAAAQTYQVQPQVTPTIPIYFQNGQGLPFNVKTIVSMVEDMGPELVGFMEPVLLNAVGSQTIDVHILVSVPPSTLNMQTPIIPTPISLTPKCAGTTLHEKVISNISTHGGRISKGRLLRSLADALKYNRFKKSEARAQQDKYGSGVSEEIVNKVRILALRYQHINCRWGQHIECRWELVCQYQ